MRRAYLRYYWEPEIGDLVTREEPEFWRALLLLKLIAEA